MVINLTYDNVSIIYKYMEKENTCNINPYGIQGETNIILGFKITPSNIKHAHIRDERGTMEILSHCI